VVSATAEALVPRADGLASVKLVGLGGVGGLAARHVTLLLRSLHADLELVLIDGDDFAPDNEARMAFRRPGNKAEVVREELLPLVQRSRLTLRAVPEFLRPDNLDRLLRPGDVVLLAVDNHATRRLVAGHCERLAETTLISGGNDGVEETPGGGRLRGTFGNVQIHLRRGGRDISPALTAYHPEIAAAQDRLPAPEGQDCLELAPSTPQILCANVMAAACMLNALWLLMCGKLHYSELAFDVHDGLMRPLPVPPPPVWPRHG
jgi:hypothetical protein